MFGQNPIRKPIIGDGSSLFVENIFHTIQGEGPYSGWPSVFIRLGGCNLACDFCDTEFEDFSEMSMDDIVGETSSLSLDNQGNVVRKLVVITGGEPLRQPIEKLCQTLIEAEYMVQIETNGTLYRDLHKDVEIVCSPKNTGIGYQPIRPDLLERISALKYIISASHDLYQDIGNNNKNNQNIPIFVQPMDEKDEAKNAENLEYTIRLAQEHGYQISLQLHKIMGIE